jgi:hypothetical protein
MKSENENDNNTYRGILGLDTLSKTNKTLVWIFCFIAAFLPASYEYINVDQFRYSSLIGNIFWWLSIMSPICIAVVAARLGGVPWRYAFLLFIFVPVVIKGIIFLIMIYALLLTGNA